MEINPMDKYEKNIQRMIVLIIELFANVKRSGFYMKPSSSRLNIYFLNNI